eukprot:23757-Rhodomonas_salina.1
MYLWAADTVSSDEGGPLSPTLDSGGVGGGGAHEPDTSAAFETQGLAGLFDAAATATSSPQMMRNAAEAMTPNPLEEPLRYEELGDASGFGDSARMQEQRGGEPAGYEHEEYDDPSASQSSSKVFGVTLKHVPDKPPPPVAQQQQQQQQLQLEPPQ